MTSSSAPPRPEIPASPRHVHLTAVAGVGMASLAGMFRAAGYDVTGSDQAVYPPMSDVLANLGIAVREGYRADNLEPRPDLVVVGNAMSRGNPEVEAMLTAGIPYCSMPEALMRFFMAPRKRAVVVGTHGKTTTSAMLSWVLHETGGDPSFMVGGASRNFPQNFRLGSGPWFVAEGDEYDTAFFDKGPKFLHYDPDALLLNAIEFDHADIYRDLDHVKGAFQTLLERLRPTAVVAASADFPEVRAVVEASGRPAIYFGNGPGATWRAESIVDDGATTRFTIVGPDGIRLRAILPLPGAINVANAIGVVALTHAMGIPVDGVVKALATFKGVKRRQEVIAEGRGITVIDDFAHHPTARYPGRRLWALFEPRSNTTRRRVFQDAFADAFAGADRVTFGALHRREQLSENERLSVDEVIASLAARGVPSESCEDPDAIAALVARQVSSGDVVVLMSNGGFGGLAGKLLAALQLSPPS
jgi:UDP-N-acetylmuramate: L-alanyl-gamma-D-glutamyl-meso-diaminopimelate ligase